ncbi:MAG: DJ-1/PfpI family protein [Bacteroidota bacterium]
MKIVIYIYNGMTMLDAIGPYEVLRNLPGIEIQLVAKTKGEITADSHFVHLNAHHSIDEVQAADILLIPGSTIAFMREMKDKEVLDWIRRIHETTHKTVSVCTGSLILAATGLLKGLPATSHWKPISLLAQHGAIVTHERMVETGKIITAAGVSAGIDMALYLAAKLKGEKAAQAAQLAIEYDPHPPFQSGNTVSALPEIIRMAEKQMEQDARKDLNAWDILTHAHTLWQIKQIKN